MPVCVKCQLVKSGVKLCADDLLCPECYQDNERQLSEMKKIKSASLTVAQDSSTTPTELTNKTRASKTKQPKAKKQPAENLTIYTTDIEGHSATPKLCSSSAVPAQPIDQHLAPQPAPASCACHDELEKLCLKTDMLQSAQTDSVKQLRVIIHQQELIIQTMQQQLSFVLSYLNISATDNNPCIQLSTNQSGDKSTINQIAPQSQPPMKQTRRLVNDFRQSVATAVYIDQSERQRRQSNVVVSGLQPSQTVSDAELFKNLCFSEFGIQPDIVKLKRLGSHQTNKVQPILVNMRQNAQAQLLISSAKQLRQSSDAAVRDHVYINPDLTRAEAEAAYQLRLQRRRRRPADQGHGPAVTSTEISEQSVDPGASTVLSPTAITVPDPGPSTGRHGE